MPIGGDFAHPSIPPLTLSDKNQTGVDVDEAVGWQNLKATIADASEIIHVRVPFSGGVMALNRLQLQAVFSALLSRRSAHAVSGTRR